MFLVTINGTIGSGKSTLLNNFARNGYKTVEEEANTDPDFDNYIKNLNDKKTVLNFQKKINDKLFKKLKTLSETIGDDIKGLNKKNIVVVDRDFRGNKLFLKNFIDNEKLFTKDDLFEIEEIKPNLQIFLKTNKSYERVMKRDRKGEKDSYDIKYLDNINDLHNEEFENDKNVIVIDTDNKKPKQIYNIVKKYISKIC